MAADGGEFHDYTLATNVERLVALIEQSLRGWLFTGLETISHLTPSAGDPRTAGLVRVQNTLQHRLPWRREPYLLTLHVPYTKESDLQASRMAQRQADMQEQEAAAAQAAAAAAFAPLERGQGRRLLKGQQQQQQQHAQQELSSSVAAVARSGHSGFQGAPSTAAAAEPSMLQQQEQQQQQEQEQEQEAEASTDDAGAASAAPQQSSSGDLDQQILEYQQLHLQLQHEDAPTEASFASASSGSLADAVTSSNASALPTPTGTTRGHLPQASSLPGPAASTLAQLVSKGLSGSGTKGASMDAESEADDVELQEDAASLQVHVPVPTELMPGSQAAQQVLANMQRDRSSTAVSRSWWPHSPPNRPWWRPSPGRRHKLQRWFGLDHFLLLVPASYSKRLLELSEAHTLASCGSLALANSGVHWPLLLPVHDGLRDAYWGAAQVGPFTVSFHSDSIHISRLPVHLREADVQLAVFAEQLMPHNPEAAAACLAARSDALLGGAAVAGGYGDSYGGCGSYTVDLSACFSYKLPDIAAAEPFWAQDDDGAASEVYAECWDEDCPWGPWASYRDPVKLLELDVVWDRLPLPLAGPATDAAPTSSSGTGSAWDSRRASQEPAWGAGGSGPGEGRGAGLLDPSAAQHWVVHALESGYSHAAKLGALRLHAVDRCRQHVALQRTGADWLWSASLAQQSRSRGWLTGVAPLPASLRNSKAEEPSFTTMLSALLTARTAASIAGSVGELAGMEWWGANAVEVPDTPPESEVQAVLHSLFSGSPRLSGSSGDGSHRVAEPPHSCQEQPDDTEHHTLAWQLQQERQQQQQHALPRTAPHGCLLGRLALHALVWGNARAVALLWQRFTAQLRFSYWEGRALLPRMPSAAAPSTLASSLASSVAVGDDAPGVRARHAAVGGPPGPDLDACLLQQKLQMLNLCIFRSNSRHGRRRRDPLSTSSRASVSARTSSMSSALGSPTAASGHGSASFSSSLHPAGSVVGAIAATLAAEAAGAAQASEPAEGSAAHAAEAWEDAWSADGLESLLSGASGHSMGGSAMQQREQGRHIAAAGGMAESKQEESGTDADGGHGSLQERQTGVSNQQGGTAVGTEQQAAQSHEQQEDAAAMDAALEAGEAAASDAAADAAMWRSPSKSRQLRSTNSGVPLSPAQSALCSATSVASSDWQSVLEGSGGSGGLGLGEGGSMAPEGTDLQMQAGPSGGREQQLQQQEETQWHNAQQQELQQRQVEEEQQQARQEEGPAADAAPEGVLHVLEGEALLHHPERQMNVPITQEPPFTTEDQAFARQAAMLRLGGTPQGRALRSRMQSALLLSDMSAFKAANPGCCFEDFICWHSPGDWGQWEEQPAGAAGTAAAVEGPQAAAAAGAAAGLPGLGEEPALAAAVAAGAPAAAGATSRLSARMAAAGRQEWRVLWEAAPAVPAAAQKPLLDPQKEGEGVLHYLETLSPAALFGQLLGVAVSEAVALLGACEGAQLPSAARVVSRFRAMASGVLRKGGGLAEALAAEGSGGSSGGEQLAMDLDGCCGYDDAELELLLAEFHYMEQVVVLAESLCHRLPGQAALCERIVHNAIEGDPELMAEGGGSVCAAAEVPEGEAHAALASWVNSVNIANSLRGKFSGSQQQRQQRQQQHVPHQQWRGIEAARASPVSSPKRAGTGTAAGAAFSRSGSRRVSSSSGGAHAYHYQPTSSRSSVAGDAEPAQALHLGEPVQREWVLQCRAAAGPCVGAPPSRMYLHEAAGNEMRLAFTLVSGGD